MNKIEAEEYNEQTFKSIDIESGSLEGKAFYDCSFQNCKFNDGELIKCRFNDCTFENCNLTMTKVQGSSFRNVTFKKCKIIGVNWTSASWPNVNMSRAVEFDDCILDSCIFSGLFLQEMKMEGCHSHHIDFSESDCEYASFIQSDLEGSIFEHTNLIKADFTDAINYTIDIFNNKLKGAKFSLPEAERLLLSLDIEIID